MKTKTKSAPAIPAAAAELITFINDNEAWVTYASDAAGTARAWRCHVSARHFPTPDRRERSDATGYGKTAADAIRSCMLRGGSGFESIEIPAP